ncbi:MAG: response regulator transcription factor [Chloroflexota bacterium]
MKVLIIEDEREIVEVLSVAFQIRWPEIELVSTSLGAKGVELVDNENPDVVILDLGLPDISGFEVLKQIRVFSNVPVLILTVRGDESDIVRGLEWGADDYMVKPFRQLELMSRIQALTRRGSAAASQNPLMCGQFRFLPVTRQLFKGETEIKITQTEANILEHLMENIGQVVTYAGLSEAVWGRDYPDSIDALRVHVRRLRQKIEKDPDHPKLILTRSGVGYSLAKEE